MPIKISRQGVLYTAEVTPPDGSGRPWRSPEPMRSDALEAALRAIGCRQPEIDAAFYEDFLKGYEPRAGETSPVVRAVLAGERAVPEQSPFTEAWVALALLANVVPRPLTEVLEAADYIWHAVPAPEQVAWAFLRLKQRGWLLEQGDSYGLTTEGRREVERFAGGGDVLDRLERLNLWLSAHPPPSDNG